MFIADKVSQVIHFCNMHASWRSFAARAAEGSDIVVMAMFYPAKRIRVVEILRVLRRIPKGSKTFFAEDRFPWLLRKITARHFGP
ncbi:hypothetical protein CN97_18825 [Haematobacter massiliensis]|uniref:Uncharacterized protein n=1 Tax=Haematobacter massiliensis TaxID=195105 RepID=A0A086Y2D2_9RHOB|nr:hypothetical protein [Haematobacter massiliensis]KFI28432.1 hypothetical protein CN97_18825 [Haematobacter massiliensis]OWJ84728.1 hypothetical protein CDV51_13725 [Haematobacter massiliensis]QBJ26440.1 hypothetical protein HmaOT1_18330 [Haematobacter massiliensis]